MPINRRVSRSWRRRITRYVYMAVALWLTQFAHASVPAFSTILGGSGQDYVVSVTTDAQGNIYAAGLTYSPDFRVTPGAFQTKAGGNSDGFVAKFSADGKLIWSTYLGGLQDDWVQGIAVDSAGNVIVTGWTRSTDFPLAQPIQATLNNGLALTDFDAFITKFDPTGSKVLYSTFLGGGDHDGANAMALDAQGNVYITGNTNNANSFPALNSSSQNPFGIFVIKVDTKGALAYGFFHPSGAGEGIAVDAAGSAYVTGTLPTGQAAGVTKTFGATGTSQAIVFKLTPDGKKEVYETALGGTLDAGGAGIAVDATGAAYVGGNTTSIDFPLVKPLQSSFGARPLWRSGDFGVNWTPFDGLPFASMQALVVDPTAPSKLYATATEGGFFQSTDGGATWSQAINGITNTRLGLLVIDRSRPRTLYTATAPSAGVIYKTTDGGDHWTILESRNASVAEIVIDTLNPDTIYAVWGDAVVRKSIDGGATWTTMAFPGFSATYFAVDPHNSANLFAFSTGIFHPNSPAPHLYHSSDGGANWTLVFDVSPGSNKLIVDGSTNPSTVYVEFRERSDDGGNTWKALPPFPGTGAFTIDSTGTLYTFVSNNGLFVSHDRGQTWSPVTSSPPKQTSNLANRAIELLPLDNSGNFYVVLQNPQSSGFVSKLSADGSTLLFSTLLNGRVTLDPMTIYIAEASAFSTQNWVGGVALDGSGNVVVAGGTRANDFPTAGAAQPASGGKADIFVAGIAGDGSKLLYSTYYGGSYDDGALTVAVDPQGNVIAAGQTWSPDFPLPGPFPLPAGIGDGFVLKLAAPGPPVITSVVNGASFQPGIEAGSWVTIKGTNLASTNPGRIWRADEVVNGALPTSLDGVSVTINGKPAFIYYISPTQINLQAPTDSTTGPVNVVVHNSGSDSAAFTAQMQTVGPALFQYPVSSYAVVTQLPGYVPVADPSTIAGTVAAKPGDTLVLWGTGFGVTTPQVPAGVVVTGANSLAPLPAVTVGGTPVQVLSAVLTPSCAGLYQITIQLPATIAPGAAEVRVSMGGVQSPAGVQLFIGR